jgi:hypothetical protein
MSNSRFAGELLVAAELTRLGLFVSLNNSFGTNTPKFDLHASNAEGKSVTIQVKALKADNSFIIDPEKVEPRIIYVFVVVGEANTMPKFWVISGGELLKVEKELFGKWGRTYPKKHGRGFQSKRIPSDWCNAWSNLGLGKLAK